MKSIILISCLLTSSFIYSQNYFRHYEHTSQYTRAQACEVIGNTVFYSKSHNSDFTPYSDFEHWLIKADDQLNRLDSVNLRNLLSLATHKALIMLDMKVDKGELELSLLSRDTAFYCGFSISHILRFDTNLNLLDSISLGTANHTFSVANTFDLNNKRLAAGYSHQCVNGNWQNLSQGVADLSLPNTYQSIDHINNSNPMAVFTKVNDTMFIYSSRVYNSPSRWVLLNENWEIIDDGAVGASPLMPGIAGQFLVFDYITRPNKLPVPISVGYNHFNNGLYWNVTVGSIDTLNNTTNSDTLPIGGTSLSLVSNTYFRVQPSPDMKDQRDLDSVFFAISPMGMTQDSFEAKVVQPIYFYTYNANTVSPISSRRVVPDYPWDDYFAVSSFSDGRILLGVNEYNWDKFGNNTMAIRWMIFPRDGSLGNQFYTDPTIAVSAFPNPTSDIIGIEGVPLDWKQINYTITDVKGRQVAEGDFTQAQRLLSFKTLGIEPGIYLLHLGNAKGENASPVKIFYN